MNTFIDRLNILIDKEVASIEEEKQNTKESNKELVKVYDELKSDMSSLIYMKSEDLKRLINSFKIEDKDRLYKEILTIKKILTMNKDYKSTLRLFKKDKDSYNYFLEKFEEYNNKNSDSDPNIIKLDNKQSEYLKLKENLNKPSYNIKSKDITLLEKIFKHNTDEDSIEVLVELMNYENGKYKERLSKSKKKTSLELNDSNLEEVFKKYKYDYSKLEDKYKNYLKEKGNLKNIEDVFTTLENHEYPIIEDSYVLTSILLGSDSTTLDKVTNFARENKLIPKSLLDISGALLTQNNNINNKDDYSIMTTGSSLDFMRNITTLRENGISINYIYQGCKSILTMPNSLLVKNLDLFNKYGFSFEYKRKGVIDPSPCALLSEHFAEITDQFIEIHPDGLKYLTDNLSNLKTVSNPDALMFYNIYESYKNFKGNLNDPLDGPFRKVMEDGKPNYQLKSIITRNKPEYRNTYYMGITEEYKKEATNTIDIDIHNKDKFDEIIKNKKDIDISNSIFSNPYVVSINKYIDYDNALIYNFDGVRISRLKVLRIYNKLIKNGIEDSMDSFMYAITYKSILSELSYTKIYNCVKKEAEAR